MTENQMVFIQFANYNLMRYADCGYVGAPPQPVSMAAKIKSQNYLMIKGITLKTPVNSSLSKAVISLSGAAVLAPKFARQFEIHVSEIISNSDDLLKVVIQNKVSMVRPAHERNKNFFGRLINRLLGKDYDHIELSGIEVIALATLLQEDGDTDIYPEGTYNIPIREAERLLARINAKLQES